MNHTFEIGQYASFTRALIGQLHFNGFLFSCISIDKIDQTNGTVVLNVFTKTLELDGYFFLRFCYGFD